MRKSARDGTEARKIDESLHQEVHREGPAVRNLHVLQPERLGLPSALQALEAVQRRHSLSDPHQTHARQEVKAAIDFPTPKSFDIKTQKSLEIIPKSRFLDRRPISLVIEFAWRCFFRGTGSFISFVTREAFPHRTGF